MIPLLYFLYAINKRNVLSLSSNSIFVLTIKILRKVRKISSFWISLHYGALRYEIIFMSRQDIHVASTNEKYIWHYKVFI